MKKIIFITVTLMLVCFNYSNSQICATGQNITSCDSFGLDSESSPSGPYYLKLFVWAIRNADGTGGETEQRIQASIEQMKSYFTDENIHFLWDCHINYINSESANTNAIFDEYLKH